jgi:hypothetical protein
MTRSSFEAPPPPGNVATGYGWWGGALPPYRFREQAASGLLATAGDLARFLAVLSSPQAQAAVGVGPATIETMLQPPPGGGFALGFGLEPVPSVLRDGRAVEGVRLVSHNGANRGFRAVIAMAPERGDGLVVLTNSDRGSAMTTDLLCSWGRRVSGVELASCWAERKRRGTLVAVAGLMSLGLVMDGAAFARRRWRARREHERSVAVAERHGWASWVRLLVSVAFLAGWWLFWYTDLFAVRREGIANFVPASALPPTFFWLTLVLTSWGLLGVARWLFTVRPPASGAGGSALPSNRLEPGS